MKIITSKQNQFIKDAYKLLDKKYRSKESKFLVEGYHLVNEAKEKGILLETIEVVDKNKFADSILVTEEILNYLSDTSTPQGIIGICKFPDVSKSISNRVLFLNNLQEPGNVGTIFRLARAFDFDTVIVQNFDYFNPKVIRSSQGALFDLNLIKTNNIDILEELKKQNYILYATMLDTNAKKLNEIDFSREEKIVIILGNEGNGIDNQTASLSDEKVYIPISFESLNVATAAAIVLNKVRNG
ncbi:RNA methyltransferase [Mycoplasma sp. 21DD0573]|uniref:TrmH family RNA methyltransferase n=1 Tax=unclassified Mycoplasma TaxID=2683645 RepID=UPI002B1D0BAC|nr:RNA methyltransferase [Mycoplasma sp. 21DD0573]MEA4276574.1 RNA methyltransferase [Mycoplasma sp. 21DD0573]